MEDEKNAKFYNDAFVEIFTHPRFIRSLLVDFVADPWVDLIDLGAVSFESTRFLGLRRDKREADLLLKFPFLSGSEVYIYLLLEFQSTPDKMGLRLLRYLLRIYEKQLKDHGRLFPVVPLVIYNGRRRWIEDRSFFSSFTIPDANLARFIPQFDYLLIDTGRFDEELLRSLSSEAAYFFLIDKLEFDRRGDAIDRMIGILRELYRTDKEVYTVLARYIGGLFEWKGIEAGKLAEWIHEGGTSMLAESIDALKAKIRREAIREGKAEGKAEGRAEGRTEGIYEGKQEGRKEGKREVALKMLRDGLSIEKIRLYTGLSDTDITDMKKDLDD